MGLIFVLADVDAASWVVEHQQMAFRGNKGNQVRDGDSAALYTTTRATGREGQVFALARIRGPLVQELAVIAGAEFDTRIGLEFEAQLPVGKGVPFSPLVPRLTFIRNKRRWSIHFFRTVVRVPDEDFQLIQESFRATVRERKS